ncbi:hypothetical protein TNCV_2007391 [Trichonephila clavipes]|nr:hypothetical protein TNCV_2007391 [Trichonephila clavipes]
MQFINNSQRPIKSQQPKVGNAPLEKYGSKNEEDDIINILVVDVLDKEAGDLDLPSTVNSEDANAVTKRKISNHRRLIKPTTPELNCPRKESYVSMCTGH